MAWQELRTAVVENDEGDRHQIRLAKNDNGEIWAFEGEGSEQLADDSEQAINDLVRGNGYELVEWL